MGTKRGFEEEETASALSRKEFSTSEAQKEVQGGWSRVCEGPRRNTSQAEADPEGHGDSVELAHRARMETQFCGSAVYTR